ncbi:uncharacterized protein LOC106132990 [Amyelois transitella]|uniref:uncharacterized protein LOC106132990 n=1 Tax=Amyelois transitella TaxID=680683 RepID=UPI00067BD354|nr:uncharacterized protein LOC106132990 [Amyelois transitella]
MYSIFLLCVLAAANAAPHYGYHHRDDSDSSEEVHRPFRRPSYSGFGESVFDTRAFWAQIANEMTQMEEILKDFYQRFPSSVSREGVDGNQYKIIIPLAGYKENEISVKARTGVLMVQALQKTEEGHQRSYLDVRTLPEIVDLSGTWSYDKDVLTIQFPIKNKDGADNPVTELTETDEQTHAPDHSREEMGHDDNDDLDADVGNRGDNDKNKEIETNEIPDKQVEATTYAVDLKNEVEFVPVSY